MTDVHADHLDQLRQRTSEKWTAFAPEVLPLFVAEMDYPLAPVIADTIIDRVRASDTGYVGGPGAIGNVFSAFAERHWGWAVDPDLVRTTTDVSVAIVEVLRVAIAPGDRVVITPPIYPPFFDLVPEAGGILEEVPLLDDGVTWSLDLAGIERAFAGGARALLLANPHNPVGLVHSREQLVALAEIAARFGATIVSDEIHGPLAYGEFIPLLSVSDAARAHAICVTSASKAFNLAGVKAALIVGAGTHGAELLHRLPEEVGFRTSLLGLHASIAAFAAADDWLAGTTRAIRESESLLRALLDQHLPTVSYRSPAASYLAWLDLSTLGWGDDPATHALEIARVALNSGPTFGAQGRGFARLNFACSPEVLTEAIERLAAAR